MIHMICQGRQHVIPGVWSIVFILVLLVYNDSEATPADVDQNVLILVLVH